MARFDVCRNVRSSGSVPYLLVLEHELFDGLPTCLVAPLVRSSDVKRPIKGLNPILEFGGERLLLMVPEMAGIPRRDVGAVVGSLSHAGPEILSAVDFLVSGG